MSYLVDIPLEQASTDFNPAVELYLRRGRLMLSTPNAIYSYDDLYMNFYLAFDKLGVGKRQMQHALILGFGTGSIPWMLEKSFHCRLSYTGVEIDEVIAGWAMRYALPRLQSPVTLYTTDAVHFAQTWNESFDLICVDIFQDEHIPESLDEPLFSENLARLLAPGGLLLWNRLADDAEMKKRTDLFYENVFSKVFPQPGFLPLGPNRMLVAGLE
ncbi:MAG: hypothetical protein KatS3mg030_754 [Saprospiraceae bacterium]|nr:MAG: hypothetical protein KatS3mg030_754 [Saprospiraceae bacterium]